MAYGSKNHILEPWWKFLNLFSQLSSRSLVSYPRRPPSLVNIGANCYLNSAIQGISGCSSFVEDIKIEEYMKNSELQKYHLLIKLLNILNEDHHVDRLEISRNKIFQNWNKPGQQDSFELLSYVINQVYFEIRKYQEKMNPDSNNDIQEFLKVSLPLRLIVRYTISCGCNQKLDTPLQADLALHVVIPEDGNEFQLQNLVDQYFDEEKIEGYKCDEETCDGKAANKIIRLRRPLPRTLCIHLQRTHWNGYRMVKVSKKIGFERNLVIKSEFCFRETKTDADESGQSKQGDQNNSGNGEIQGQERVSRRKTEDDNENHYGYREFSSNSFQGNADSGVHGASGSVTNSSDKSHPPIAWNKERDPDKRTKEVDMAQHMATKCEDIQNEHGKTDEKGERNRSCDSSGPQNGVTVPSCTPSQIISEQEVDGNTSNNSKDEGLQQEGKATSQSSITGIFGLKASASNSGLDVKTSDEGHSSATSQLDKREQPSDNEHYRLVSVIVHFGTVYGGHYICYKRINEKWYLTDDSHISEVTEARVLSSEAYILFYDREK